MTDGAVGKQALSVMTPQVWRIARQPEVAKRADDEIVQICVADDGDGAVDR